MRADVIWAVVWGTCFIGGVIWGSTGAVKCFACGSSSSPNLRGTKDTTTTAAVAAATLKKPLLPKNVVEHEEPSGARNDNTEAATLTNPESPQRQQAQQQRRQEEEHEGGTEGKTQIAQQHRKLGSSEANGSDLDSHYHTGHRNNHLKPVVFRRASKDAQRVHALSGGLWGPSSEERKEMAKDLSPVRQEELMAPPVTSASHGDEEDEEREQDEKQDSPTWYYSDDFDFNAVGMSYSYTYNDEYNGYGF